MAEVSAVCLNFAGKLADAGYGALSRVTAFTERSKVVLFALEHQVGQESSMRVFGARMKAATDTDAVVKKIKTLVHDTN